MSKPIPAPPRVSTPVFTCKPGAQNALQEARARGEYPGGAADMAARVSDARETRRQDRCGR